MNEAARTAARAAITPEWKWLAVLTGLAVRAALSVMAAVPNR